MDKNNIYIYIYAKYYIYIHIQYTVYIGLYSHTGFFNINDNYTPVKSAPISTVANPPFVDNCLIETHVFFISMLVYPRIHDKITPSPGETN